MSARESNADAAVQPVSDTLHESLKLLPEDKSAVDADIPCADQVQEPVNTPSQPLEEERPGAAARGGHGFGGVAYEKQDSKMDLSHVLERGFAEITTELRQLNKSMRDLADNMKSFTDAMSIYIPRQLAIQKEMLNIIRGINSSLQYVIILNQMAARQCHSYSYSATQEYYYAQSHGYKDDTTQRHSRDDQRKDEDDDEAARPCRKRRVL